MSKKALGTLLTIADVCLLLSAAVCTCLCLFSPEKNSLYLGIALGSLILSGLCRVATRRRRLK